MTAALTNYSHAEIGMKRKRPVLSHPIPFFYQHFDLNETSVPLIPHFLLVYQPPLAAFPSLLSQDPMMHHFNLPLFSTFNFLDPLPSPHTPYQPPTPDSSSHPSSLCLHEDCQEQLGRSTQHHWLVPPQIYVFWSQLNSQHHSQTVLSQLPLTFPSRAILNPCPIPLLPSFWWPCPMFWKKWSCQCVILLLSD